MRGSPLLRALCAFLAILSLGYPLWRLTSAEGDAAAPAEAAPAAAEAAATEITLQISFTTPPRDFAIQHLGKDVWSEKDGQPQAERKLRIPFPKEGVELHFTATFPEGAPLAAARLVLTDPAGDDHTKSVWGTGSIDEIVTFP